MLVILQLAMKMIMILLTVAFFSLYERKILSVIQARKGPNKVGIMGMLQPFSDALKLLTKIESKPYNSVKLMYFISPLLVFLFSMMVWLSIPISWSIFSFQSNLLYLVFCWSISVYSIISSGWFSNSKFATLGSVRAIVQSISYEIILSFSILFLTIICNSTSIHNIIMFQEMIMFILPFPFIAIFMFISFLAESNRSPFDLSEGESELVAGYTIEYGGMSYTLVFLGENASLLFMSFIFSVFFLSKVMIYKMLMIVFLFVWIRGTLPRIRIDQMMMLCWIKIIPLMMSLVLLYFCLS